MGEAPRPHRTMKSISTAFRRCCVAAFLPLLALNTHADGPTSNAAWTGATSNDWQNSANWTPAAPDSTTYVAIAGGLTPFLSGASANVDIYTLSVTESSHFTLSAGATLNSIGGFINDGATVTLTGADTAWTNSSTLTVGHSSTGTLFISDGATATIGSLWTSAFSFATGNITIDGAGSKLISTGAEGRDIIGSGGPSQVTVSNGGLYDAAEIVVGFYNPGLGATLTITGAGSQLNTGFLKLAEYGEGHFVISAGGVANTGDVAIAYNSSNGAGNVVSTATVTGTGSRWNISGNLGIGTYSDAENFSYGTLTIADGAVVSVKDGTGTVVVSSTGTLNIGTGGLAGTLSAASIETSGALVFNHTDNVTFAATIKDDLNSQVLGTLVKSGSGTLILTGANTYTGATTVNAGTLQIGDGGTTGSLSATGGIINNAILAFNRSNNLSYSGAISGTGKVTKDGAGTLTLSGASTYAGGTTVSAGTLRATTVAGALGAGSLTLSGGNLELGNNSDLNFGRATTVSANTTITSDRRTSNGAGVTHTLGSLSIGAQTLTVAAGSRVNTGTAGITFGATTLTGNATFNVGTSARLTLGAIGETGGNRGLTKSGSGNLTLSGANTYSGLTTINAGTLALSSGSSLANTSAIRVGSGATFDVSALSGGFTFASGQTFGGSGSVNGLVTLAAGSHLAPGSSPGTITFTGGLSLNTGALLDFELGPASDLIRVSGGTLTGPGSGKLTVNLFNSGGFTAGTYTLIDATGATLTSIGATQFEIGTTIAGYAYTFSQVGNQFLLTASAIPEPATFAAITGALTLAVAAGRRQRRTTPGKVTQ